MKLNDKQRELAEKNERFAYYVANKFRNTGIEHEELCSIALIGLCKASYYFDKDRGLEFTTFAGRVIANEILLYLRKLKRKTEEVSINDPVGINESGKAVTIEEKIRYEEDYTEYETKEYLDEMMACLSQKEREVLDLLKYKNQGEVGEILNLSQSYVSRLQKKAHKKLIKYHEKLMSS